MPRFSWLVTAALLGATAGAGAQPAPLAARHDAERPAHDAVHYDVWIRLADSGSRFAAAVTTDWKLIGHAPIRINLDSSYRIGALTLNGKPARWHRASSDLLLVTLPPGAGLKATTRIEYDGHPPKFVREGRQIGRAHV